MKKLKKHYPVNLYFIIEGSRKGMMGGVENSLFNTITNLDKDLFSSKVIFNSKDNLFSELKEKGYNVKLIKGPIFRSIRYSFSKFSIINPIAIIINLLFIIINSLGLIIYLKHCGKQNGIITYGLNAHIYGSLSAKLIGLPCIWHLQDLISDRYSNLFISFMNILARSCTLKIIVDGSDIARQFKSFQQNRQKTTILFNGIDTEKFLNKKPSKVIQKNYGITENDLVIGNVGRLVSWKGQKYLIEAFIQLLSKHNNLKLLLVGDAIFENDNYYKLLKNIVNQYDKNSKVIFTGYLTNLEDVYPIIDIYVHSSISKDTNPLSLLGAMASGRPIVAVDIPGIKDLIKNNNNGIIVKPRSPDSLAFGISQFIEDIDLRFKIGQENRNIASKMFSLETYIKRYEDELLNTLLLNN